METLRSFALDGRAALRSILESSSYGSIQQAVASLAIFTHPDTVRQTDTRNVFLIIRDQARRGKFVASAGVWKVMLDDNKGPTDAFVWAHTISRNSYEDVQFNHIWPDSKDPTAYTNLANICMMPAFLSKLADTDRHICGLLRYQSYFLYGYHPTGGSAPDRPAGYDTLQWADPLPAVPDLEGMYRRAMSRKPKDRTTVSARELGWVFSEFQPDPSL